MAVLRTMLREGLLLLAALPALSAQAAYRWAPKTSFQYQLQGSIRSTSSKVIFVDLFDTSSSKIASLKSQGKTVVCYFSAGTAENWRSDYKSYPSSVKGKSMEDWAGEKWVNLRSSTVLSILVKRLDLARSKGCHGVDPDNVDGYSHNTGFSLKKSDTVTFLRNLASAAHERGLGVGLKNSSEIASQVSGFLQWVVAEQCYEYNECGSYSSFVQRGKAVYIIEYRGYSSSECSKAKSSQFSLIYADLDLDGTQKSCT
jgi:hypothetical protein